MSFFSAQNPGIDLPEELTSSELLLVQNIASLDYQEGDILLYSGGMFVNQPLSGSFVTYTGASETLDMGAENIVTTGSVVAGIVEVDDDAYDSSWDGSLEVPTKNAVYDALQSIDGAIDTVNGQTGTVVLDTDDISEGTALYFTDERAQDAIGSMINSTLVYNDTTPSLGRAAISGAISISAGSNTSSLNSGVVLNVHINAAAAIDATKIGDGSVTSTEFSYINSLTSNAQTQLNNKVGLTGDETIAGVKTFSSIPVLPASDPSTANQATRKSYVDAIAAAIDPSLRKASCEVVSTSNITLSGEQTIDGVLTNNSRVLVNGQTNKTQNGIYISTSGSWVRASDYDTAVEIKQGTSVFVTSGTVNERTQWFVITPDVTTLGSDDIEFTQAFSPANYLPGNGISISGNTISADTSYLESNLGFVDSIGSITDNAIPLFNGTSGDIDDSGLIFVSNKFSPKSVTGSNGTALTISAGNNGNTSGGTSYSGGTLKLSAGDGYDGFEEFATTGAYIELSESGFLYDGGYAGNNLRFRTNSFSPTLTLNLGFLSSNLTVYTPRITGYISTEGVVSLSDGATVALNASLGTVFTLSASGNRTILTPTGSPYDGQKITIRHTASGAARTLSLTTGSSGAFRFGSDIPALTETASGKTDYIGCIYNSSAARWDVVSYVKGF